MEGPHNTAFFAWLSMFFVWYSGPVVSLAVSVLYFAFVDKQLRLSRRLIASMSGLSVAVIYVVAMIVALTGNANSAYGTAFEFAQLVPIALVLAAFTLYKGPKWVHLLQIPNGVSFLWSGFLGGMAVTGNWL